MTPRPTPRCSLLESRVVYSVFVGIMGFSVGLGAGDAGEGTKAEVISMLQLILWVAFQSAALLGAALGAIAMAGLGPEVAGKVTAGAAGADFISCSESHSGLKLFPSSFWFSCLGVVVVTRGVALKATLQTTSELITITFCIRGICSVHVEQPVPH